MGNDLVSIIMLSRNRAEFVAESVRSVMAQTYTNWELLFVDDNSTDDTIHQMMELKGKDKRISVLTSVYDKGTAYQELGAERGEGEMDGVPGRGGYVDA